MRATQLAVGALLVAAAVAAVGVWRGDSKRVAPAAETTASPGMALPFIHNDYPKALAEARARKLPIFIETWAPW
jgi:endonuclease YncB( thermonuclease family)